jgi:hypothetical protein
MRVPRIIRSPGEFLWIWRVGWFVIRAPARLEQSNVAAFLDSLEVGTRPASADPETAVERIVRLRSPWLHLPALRGRDTCYVRALTLYRFVAAPGHDVQFNVGAEWFDEPGGVLRGHAWVTIDGITAEEPPGVDDHEKLQLIELRPRQAV